MINLTSYLARPIFFKKSLTSTCFMCFRLFICELISNFPFVVVVVVVVMLLILDVDEDAFVATDVCICCGGGGGGGGGGGISFGLFLISSRLNGTSPLLLLVRALVPIPAHEPPAVNNRFRARRVNAPLVLLLLLPLLLVISLFESTIVEVDFLDWSSTSCCCWLVLFLVVLSTTSFRRVSNEANILLIFSLKKKTHYIHKYEFLLILIYFNSLKFNHFFKATSLESRIEKFLILKDLIK